MLRPLFAILLATAASVQAGELRVLSWNLHHGVGEDDKLDLERIAKVISEQKPDLVALQEIDNKCRRSKSIDEAAELARLTGLHVAFGKAMDFDGGAYGQAILSRFPIGDTQVHQLPGDGEPRIAFEAEVKIDGKPLRMVTVHLDHQQDARRLKQAETLAKALENHHEPMILAGDFNDGPESAPLKAFAAQWQAVPKKEPKLTCPAGKPSSEIDHIFLGGLERKEDATVLQENVASDHRPVVAVIKLPD
ncbi:endonuclease/exonuclease/phosphatase family protein [Haloferula sp. BvORR071]|uniref:endonuclease/exonuclease/phosphatase family protein n=1 Tax=Haloferula sp. BvORR071 TaxID=1396141 RepID=UPI00055934FE|nr:endonuclease/exonuclease/phosphatase family protein [Haloferula sp. BvORR071]